MSIAHNIHESDKGLTLLELLIAVMLAAIAVSGIYSFYFAGVQSWERNALQKESQQNARLAIRAVEQDLRYADWVWIGDNWEDHWRDEDYPEPGEGDVIYYIFWGDKRSTDPRPHLIFNKMWRDNDNTVYLRRKVLLTEQNFVYYVNPAPYYLADNINELSFSYEDASKERLNITVEAGNDKSLTGLQSSVFLRNIK